LRLRSPPLFWRTFLLILLLFAASMAAWWPTVQVFEREPRARQIAQQVVSIVNTTRSALVFSDPGRRRDLLNDLADNEGIRVVPLEPGDQLMPLPDDRALAVLATDAGWITVRETTGTSGIPVARRPEGRPRAGGDEAVRRASLGVSVGLLVEYALGLYVSLYVTVPARDQGGGVLAAVGRALANGPAGLAVHAGLGLLLHRIGWSVQVPARQAAERDEARIARWKEQTWPAVKGRRRTWVPGSASKTSPARA